MDGYVYYYPSGHWIKIAAKIMVKSNNYPYGVKYSLTLHNPSGKRILGYDNAHLVPGDKCDSPYDHKHRGERILNYPYHQAGQLLKDFYQDVEQILEFERGYEYEI